MKKGRKVYLSKASIYFIVSTIALSSYIVYLVFINYFDATGDNEHIIFVLSWIGIFLGLFIIWSWHQLTGQLFTLYTIFVLFFFLFNFGQPLMWAFGIHQPDEIGAGNLYLFGKATSRNIIYTQALTLMSILMFHLGAVFCYKPRRIKHQLEVTYANTENKKLSLKALYYASILLSIIVIPVSLYVSLFDLYYAQLHGYSALYYDPNKPSSSLLGVIHYMFLPTLIGLLIGSNYKKKVRYFVYFTFLTYLIINLLSGDRGSWVYGLVLFIYMSHTFFKKIKVRKMILYGVGGLFFLYIVNAIVQLRNVGITAENILEAISFEQFPITTFIFEMGSSMQPAIVLLQYGWDIWPYSNTYLMAIMGVVSTKIFTLFDVPFSTIGSWFSQEYLGISYGAGFSIVAESLLNYGPVFSPLFMIVLGYVLSSLTYIDKDISIHNQPLRVFFAVATMSSFIKIARGDLHFTLKSWFFGVLIFIFIIFLIREFLKSKLTPVHSEEVKG